MGLLSLKRGSILMSVVNLGEEGRDEINIFYLRLNNLKFCAKDIERELKGDIRSEK